MSFIIESVLNTHKNTQILKNIFFLTENIICIRNVISCAYKRTVFKLLQKTNNTPTESQPLNSTSGSCFSKSLILPTSLAESFNEWVPTFDAMLV
jgi:hypothetical protein